MATTVVCRLTGERSLVDLAGVDEADAVREGVVVRRTPVGGFSPTASSWSATATSRVSGVRGGLCIVTPVSAWLETHVVTDESLPVPRPGRLATLSTNDRTHRERPGREGAGAHGDESRHGIDRLGVCSRQCRGVRNGRPEHYRAGEYSSCERRRTGSNSYPVERSTPTCGYLGEDGR